MWEKYAVAAKLLLKGEPGAAVGGKVLASTIAENKEMMKELLALEERRFKPSIPNLVYQYSIYTTYPSSILEKDNPEIPSDDY